MNSAIVQRIADAILYEGYILYPSAVVDEESPALEFWRFVPEIVQ